MPKSSKRFVLSDDSLNKYGFRMLTAGADLSQFRRNPVMLFMHTRPFHNVEKQVLPLGYWDDIQVADNQITAIPVFDDNDEFAMRIYHKVENGTLRMASAGAEPIETSIDEDDLVPGQRYATITKWKMEEASIVDIGGNENSLALYHNGQVIQLADGKPMPDFIPLAQPVSNSNTNTMKKITLLASMLTLAAGADDDAVIDAAIQGLKERDTLKKENEDLKLAAQNEKVEKLVGGAVLAGKITEGQKAHYVKLAQADYETTETLLGGMKEYKPVQTQLAGGGAGDKKTEHLAWGWDDFQEKDPKGVKLADLKQNNWDRYAEIFEDKFNVAPTK